MIESFLNIDSTILLWIQEHLRVEVLNPVFIVITTLGNGGAIWIICSNACFKKDQESRSNVSVCINNFSFGK